MKTVLDIINALTNLGIVGFLVYLFIYYRKAMKSILHAIGDVDSLKAGSLEYKRRTQLNKVVEAVQSESQLPSKSAIESPPVRISLEEYNKQLESENIILKKQVLGAATVATSTATNILDPDRIEYFKRIAAQSYADLKQTDPHSYLIGLAGFLEDLKPPEGNTPDESQQSKP